MPRHHVEFTVPWRNVGYEDIVFKVEQEGERLGTLKISKGAIVWRPARKKQAYRLGWERFDRMAQESGTRGDY